MSKRTTSGAWLKGITEMLATQGLDIEVLLGKVGLNSTSVSNANFRCPSEKVSALWDLAVESSDNPAISLASPHVARPATFDVVGYTMMSSPTLRAAFDRLVRYLRIVSDAATVEVFDRGGECTVSLQVFGGEAAVPRQRIEFDLLMLLSFSRWSTGLDLRPKRVEFSYPEPADTAPFDVAFGCPIRFDATANGLRFASHDLETALLASHAMVAELHESFAAKRLEQLENAQMSYRAREIIIRKLPDGEPRREEIAVALCMSDRQLQRRFQEEGTTFQQLLDNTRRELAQQYLRQGHLTLAQTAYLLGFADQSNFFRACKRWFDLSPGQYRAKAEPTREGKEISHASVGVG